MGWTRAIGAAVATFALTVPASAQGEAAFPDGDWQGVLVYSAALEFGGGGTGTGTGNGQFSVTVQGGEVRAGAFGFTATSEVVVPGGSGSATVSSDNGTITGPAGAPLLTPGDLRISGTVTVNGLSIPVDLTLPADQAGALVLTIDAVGCDRISGDMSQEVAETFESQGVGAPRLVFRWSAVRSGAGAAVTEALAGAVEAADKLVIAAARGDLDPAAVGDLLGEAEAISADLPGSGDCPTATFSTPLSGAVADLLTTLSAPGGPATAGQLWAAVNAGIRTGVLTAGSPLADQVTAALAARLDGLADGAPEAYSVYLSARALGDASLADRALAVVGAG